MLEYSAGKVAISVGILVAYFVIMFLTAFVFQGSKMKECFLQE